jgi:hypothetical protein
MRIQLPNGWKPRPYQLKAWSYLENGGKRACLIWSRRIGKDDVALNWAAVAAHERVAEYWHMLPEAAQARKAIWDAVNPHTGRRRIDQAFPLELREKTREDEMMIRLKNGSLWRVVGSDNYQSLLGSTPAGVVFSEWALANPQSWAFLRPILTENKGWVIFITTPRGDNHAAGTLKLAKADPNWFWQIITAQDSGVFSREDLERELREYQSEYGLEEGKALFEQEYCCSFSEPMIGSYYGPYLTRMAQEGRIVQNIPIDRGALVHTAWDLGRSDSTAIWFIQRVGLQTRLIDYHEASGIGLTEYAAILDDRRAKYRWVYGKHYFPHDMAQHEWGNKLSRVDTAKQLGYQPIIVDQHHDMDGVNAVRRLLDTAYIDETRCERGLNALRNFRRQWDEKRKVFHDKYLHDWASHGAKALETYAMGFRDPKVKPDKPPVAPALPSFAAMPHNRGTAWMGRR